MLVYYLSVFKCPVSIANRIEKLQKECLSQSGGPEKKIHLVDWESVCRPKSAGGKWFSNMEGHFLCQRDFMNEVRYRAGSGERSSSGMTDGQVTILWLPNIPFYLSVLETEVLS